MTALELLSAGPYVHSSLSLAVLGTAVVVAALGVYPLVRREALQESLFFFPLCLAIAVWLFGFGWTYASSDPDRAMRWIRLAYLGIPLIPAALFTVAVHSLGVADRRRWHLGVLWFGAGEMIRRADLAMYHVKSGLHGQVGTFEPRLKEAADRRLRIERDLKGAAGREELRLVYHPVMDLVEGGVAALEALLRWEHPELGRLDPGEFIRLAEETGEIVPFGRWTLGEACRQMRSWREAIPEAGDLRIMVNVSEAEIADGEYAGTVREALAETGLSPDALELEVTERMVTGDAETLDETLQDIRELGVHVSVDDFGTGTSSLQMVRRLHLDGLKIDRSFVHRVAQDERGRRFIRSILDLARDLDLRVIAEGVEEADDLDMLREMEIDRAQGFPWTEPLSATEVPDFLAGTGASTGEPPPWTI